MSCTDIGREAVGVKRASELSMIVDGSNSNYCLPMFSSSCLFTLFAFDSAIFMIKKLLLSAAPLARLHLLLEYYYWEAAYLSEALPPNLILSCSNKSNLDIACWHPAKSNSIIPDPCCFRHTPIIPSNPFLSLLEHTCRRDCPTKDII